MGSSNNSSSVWPYCDLLRFTQLLGKGNVERREGWFGEWTVYANVGLAKEGFVERREFQEKR